MISFCIATYNFNVTDLVNQIVGQSENLDVEYEVIVIDDASQVQYPIEDGERVHYYSNQINLGRSKTRNKLVSLANYQYVIFIDGDSSLPQNFVKNYLEVIGKCQVVCGGTQYKLDLNRESKLLRWKYGVNREQISVKERNSRPFESMSFNNAMIHKDIFSKIEFDESLKEYGHEDTLFAFELKNRKIDVIHIDNSVFHLGIDENEVFVEKTEKGIQNLKMIRNKRSDISSFVRILRVYDFLTTWKLLWILSLMQKMEKVIKKRIIKKSNLLLFDIYKLIVLHKSS